MPERELITLAERFHAALERQDMQALERIITAYADIMRRLDGEIEALIDRILELENPTAGQIYRLGRFKSLMKEADDQLRAFQGFLGVELRSQGRLMIGRGLSESLQLMAAATGQYGSAQGRLRNLPTETVETLLGFLDPKGPLYQRLDQLAPTVTDLVARKIVESIGIGQNPRKWSRVISDAFGMGLSDSLRMARTVQLWSYRESTRANYVLNSDIVRGWVWWASLDPKVCLSCVAQHGTVHSLDETLNDHHAGRCSMLPLTITMRGNPVEQPGVEWFSSLSAAEQKKMMGPGRFQAWKEGKFDLPALSVQKPDDVYGLMRREATLAELVSQAAED